MSSFPVFSMLVAAVPLPTPDPMGYPVPVELLRGLSYLTLTLHLLAMNFTLGGAMLWLWIKVRKPAHGESMLEYLGTSLPLGFSYLVTLGIPPLLFLQVVYGQFFYSSSVVMGLHWIHVIPLLILGYGMLYYHKLTRHTRPRNQWIPILIAVLAMLAIGFIYVNNLTLMQTPDKWLGMYAARPNGASLNLAEPTLFPRYLLFLAPALAVAGMGLLTAGTFLRRWGRIDKGVGFQKTGFLAVLVGMGAALVVGAWTVITLPESISAQVTSGGWITILLGTGMALVALAGVVSFLASRSASPWFSVGALLLAALGLASHVIMRDLVRIAYLKPYFDAATVPVNNQWVMFGMFAATLVGGLALVIVLTVMVAKKLTPPPA
jgi:hypothetical protein